MTGGLTSLGSGASGFLVVLAAKLRVEAKPMTVTVKNKTPLVVPSSVSRKAGIKSGDQLEFRVSGGVIIISPKLPAADKDYTTAERAIIDARLAESEEELNASRGYGPFDSAAEMVAHMKAALRKPAPAKRKKRPR